jgi:hypothetical protein
MINAHSIMVLQIITLFFLLDVGGIALGATIYQMIRGPKELRVSEKPIVDYGSHDFEVSHVEPPSRAA